MNGGNILSNKIMLFFGEKLTHEYGIEYIQ